MQKKLVIKGHCYMFSLDSEITLNNRPYIKHKTRFTSVGVRLCIKGVRLCIKTQ